MWRDPELEALLGASLDLDELREADLQRLIDTKVREAARIDFKSHPYSKSQDPEWPATKELAKDVAAFANHLGGLVIIGVKDVDGVASTLTPVDASAITGETEEQWVRQAIREHVVPLVPVEVKVVPALKEGHWYLVIAVPRSLAAPHALRYPTKAKGGKDKRPLSYPERDGADTRWLEEPEIADRYLRRREFTEAHRRRIGEVIRAGRQLLRRSGDGLWLYATSVPEAIREVGPLDAETVAEADRWYRDDAPPKMSLDTTVQLPWGSATPSAGRVSFSEMEEIDAQGNQPLKGDAIADLYPTGPGFAAVRLGGNNLGYPNVDVDELEQAGILLGNLLLAWTVHSAGAWGTATLAIGLDWGGVPLDNADWKFVPHRYGRISGTHNSGFAPALHARVANDRPTAEIEVDLAPCVDQEGRLRSVHLLLRQLVQWFGLIGPSLLGADGEFEPGWLQLNQHKFRDTIAMWTPPTE